MNRKRNFFVRHLPVEDKRRQNGYAYQIQVVDRTGVAIDFVYVQQGQDVVEIMDACVPIEVLNAAWALAPGKSSFVRFDGKLIAPKDLLE
jgi:hypothetical protein